MQKLQRDIMEIKRPRALMNAAKEVVKSTDLVANELSKEALTNLINEEAECENARLNARWQYSPSKHVSILAKLINHARHLSIKGQTC